ncbi:MAG TPA: hypothetical protein VGD95_08060 [Micavibrio sp.]
MKKYQFLTGVMALALIAGGASASWAAETVKKTVTTTTTTHNAPLESERLYRGPDGRLYAHQRVIYDADGREFIEYYDTESDVIYTTPTTITRREYVEPRIIPGTRALQFRDLDINRDGILSRREVGQRLFYVFDTDGNGVIDNIEYGNNSIMTVIPLERTELTMVDLDDDGRPDMTNVTRDQFMDYSMLARFDYDGRGVSPESFLNKNFYMVDTDRSGVIEWKEWREVYAHSRSPLNARQYRYN